ncbi:MAG: hypothetical protein IJZ82_00690 [Lachnospiraceae bacterium]|nr:hypothetical protein [Lachnospiraceae bacterium]
MVANLVSVIGGADGPTAVFVAGSLGGFWPLLIPCILLVFMQYKLCKNEKKWVRFSMLILAGVMALLVFLNVISGFKFLSFLIGGFVALIMLIMAVCLAASSALGWLIYYIVKKRKG